MCDTIGRLNPDPIFAKNSDRSPNEPQVLEWYPAKIHEEKMIKTTYIEVEQVKETKALLLSRPIWLWGGEMGVNECGVCIGNEAVFTKGKYGPEALTGMDMVRLALERSTTAKEAVDCLIMLLERYGQGGNCGYDHQFYYDNAFLVMDAQELYVLETAGKNWVYKKSDRAAISNCLSIGADGDVYNKEKCDFAKMYTEPIHTMGAKAVQRRGMCNTSLQKAETVPEIMKALRQHKNENTPLCRGSVGSPCMHFGGLVGDHTTQSMVVELDSKKQPLLWVTGRSMPCVSLFKPFVFGDTPVAPIYHVGDTNVTEYWKSAEEFNRKLLGHILPEEYYAQRDALEAESYRLSRGMTSADLAELTREVLVKEKAFLEQWSKVTLEKGKTSAIYRMNWKKKNQVFHSEKV